jgi:hypothetical protein
MQLQHTLFQTIIINVRLLSIHNKNKKGSQNIVLRAIEDEDCFTCEGIRHPGKL